MAKILSKVSWLGILLVMISIQGCVVATDTTVITPMIRDLFQGKSIVDPYMEGHRPVTVAVLPFMDQSRKKEGAVAVRKGFYNHFSSLPFKDMELQRVDNLLMKANLSDPEAIFKASPQELGKLLNVDAVVFGEISNFDKLFAVMYSQVAVGAEIKMFDTKTGNFLWSGQHTVRIHEGGLSVTPFGIIATVIATAMNVRDIQLLRACDDLFRDMVKTIPVPTIADALRPPVISLLTQDSKNLPKKAGDVINVVIQGAPKMQAYFDIGEFKKHIDMQEMEPGWYLGTYKVLPGDNVSQAMIVGYLADDAGNASQWVDALGTVTLDTTPPDKIKNLQTVGRNNLLLLNWDKSPATDLAGYRLYRSLTPLSGFQEVGRSELNEWRDDKVTNGQKYYYFLTAIDWAGNESEKIDPVIGLPIAPGPTAVNGPIEADITWYSGASPYIIDQTILVKDKATLTIEPGTEVRSSGGGIVIEGQIKARGTKEHLITLTSTEEGKVWEGISFNNTKEKEQQLAYLRISNAKTAISCEASSPRVEDSELTANLIALKIVGAFSRPELQRNSIHKNKQNAVLIRDGAQPKLSGNTISDNLREGVVIESSSPLLRDNVIARNQGIGIQVQASNAVITGNKILDNSPLDMQADMSGEPVQALENWWGTVSGINILARIRGKVNIAAILDGDKPAGKPIKLPILDSQLGGPVDKDSFLILSNSPYRIAKDIVIINGATLYIEPGVTLLYDQGRAITVEDGGVMAKGTKELPIIFTASAKSLLPGSYSSAVRFTKQTKVNSAFSYCVVKYAETAFDIHYGAPEISYCLIANNSQNGVFCRHDAAPKITFCTFLNNDGEAAIQSVGMSRPVINYNNFLKNTFAIQARSTIYIDARYNWWGSAPPDDNYILKNNDDSINIKPWLERAEEKAFKD
jgi:hypothetical protein